VFIDNRCQRVLKRNSNVYSGTSWRRLSSTMKHTKTIGKSALLLTSMFRLVSFASSMASMAATAAAAVQVKVLQLASQLCLCWTSDRRLIDRSRKLRAEWNHVRNFARQCTRNLILAAWLADNKIVLYRMTSNHGTVLSVVDIQRWIRSDQGDDHWCTKTRLFCMSDGLLLYNVRQRACVLLFSSICYIIDCKLLGN